MAVIELFNSLSTSAGFASVVTTNDCPAGATVVIFGITNSATNSFDPAGVGDDVGSTYVQIGSTLTGLSLSAILVYAFNVGAMPAGSSFICGFLSGAPSQIAWSAIAITNATATDPLDSSNTATGNSQSPTATLTTVASDTVLIGGVGAGLSSAGAYTQASGFSTPFTKGGSSITLAGGNKTLSAAGSNTYAPSISSNAAWVEFVAAFKITPATASGTGNFFAFF